MTDTLTPFDVIDALPGVQVDVYEILEDIPDNAAVVLTGEPFGQAIIIHDYYGPDEPRPLNCPKHGIQRHDRKNGKWVCKVCKR